MITSGSVRPFPARIAAPVAAAGIGLLAGALTAYLQGVLPEAWNTIANSGAVWTVIAFAVAVGLTRSLAHGAVIGGLVLVGEVLGYYGYDSGLQHIPQLHSAEILWTVAAIWVGPLAGVAAQLVRHGAPAQRVTALLAVCGVVVGEGCYLLRLAGVPATGRVEIGIGLLAALAAVMFVPAAIQARLAAIAAGVLVAGSVYVLYSQPIIA
jgi:uncharacterized membrane protein